MSERTMLLLILAGIGLWRAGGAGFHWARRFIWPAVVGIVLAYHGLLWWQVLGCVCGLALVNALPYGEYLTWDHQEFPMRWPLRVGVLTSLALPSLWLSWHLWALRLALMGGLSSLFFWLSRRYNRFSHLLFESLAGFLQALTIIVAV